MRAARGFPSSRPASLGEQIRHDDRLFTPSAEDGTVRQGPVAALGQPESLPDMVPDRGNDDALLQRIVERGGNRRTIGIEPAFPKLLDSTGEPLVVLAMLEPATAHFLLQFLQLLHEPLYRDRCRHFPSSLTSRETLGIGLLVVSQRVGGDRKQYLAPQQSDRRRIS